MKKVGIVIIFNFLIFSFQTKNDFYSAVDQDLKFAESIKRGKEIYEDMCVSCHSTNGEGKRKVYPPLAKSDYLIEKREASIRAIKFGLRGKITVNGIQYKRRMARLGLDNGEVADVMNYITNSWGNKNDKMITIKEVESVSKK
ncbi:c-type cytochrome [Polaribacter cellanae]|uniref:Cytochrome c n=1 Tax=Polaribacter cellanae TaxID=2818493 RepID=A0A975CN97_9FLAO|nr:cytochrome c [Polaribacter cellanae]QTE22728.1 cytochrome c [Polaribacter cellanae]